MYINAFYDKIVDALRRVADEHCSKTSASYYKHYWDDQLTDLKHKSIAAHDMWKAVGRLSQGPIYEAKRCAKAEYTLARKASRQQRVSIFLMICMIISCQKIPLPSGKHESASLKANANFLCQWMTLLNPIKFPMPLPSIFKTHVHPVMITATRNSEINFLLASANTIQLVITARYL